jgi:molybdenum cofactor biosynthesis enzyme MoaA
MISDKYLDDEDFVIQIKPHLDAKGWTGDVSLNIMVGKDNPLNDDDFEAMLNFTRQICATVPLMEHNKLFRDAVEAEANKHLPIEDVFDIPSKPTSKVDKEEDNVIHITFGRDTKH